MPDVARVHPQMRPDISCRQEWPANLDLFYPATDHTILWDAIASLYVTKVFHHYGEIGYGIASVDSPATSGLTPDALQPLYDIAFHAGSALAQLALELGLITARAVCPLNPHRDLAQINKLKHTFVVRTVVCVRLNLNNSLGCPIIWADNPFKRHPASPLTSCLAWGVYDRQLAGDSPVVHASV
jgi:hypothetical protein